MPLTFGRDAACGVTAGNHDELAKPAATFHHTDGLGHVIPKSGGVRRGGDCMETSVWNRILRVDLSAGRTWTERPGLAFFRKYVGGRSLIAHYLLSEVPRGIDAFDPQTRLIFAMGPITGVALPGAGRHSVGGKSPLTGLFGEAEAGGYWGAELKQAGWDGIVIQGQAAQPVYLWIKDQEVEIRAAGHLWGQLTGPVEDQIRAELGDPQIRVAQIGPAGENLVRFACVMNDLNEAAGRTGLGALMGSKKLKAIAVRGSPPVPVADAGPIKATARWVGQEARREDGVHYSLHTWGTGLGARPRQLEGHLPAYNFRDGQLDGWDNTDAMAIQETVLDHMDRCFACSVRCKKRVKIETPRVTVEPRYGGPEYETFAAIGTNLGITDLLAVCRGNQLVNSLGLDSISCGASIAWAMEAAELGDLTSEDLQGDSLRFGSSQDLLSTIEKIAYRQGIGDLLAEGALRAARQIGKGSERYVVHVKGLDVGLSDPRAMLVMRHNYPVSPTGGDHTGAAHKKTSLSNTIGLCWFLHLQYDDDKTLELLNAATGWGMTPQELHEVSERGLTMARLFNLREGMTAADDRLPERFHQPIRSGPLSDYRLPKEEVQEFVQAYYEQHGWDRDTGVPLGETLERLGLSGAAYALT